MQALVIIFNDQVATYCPLRGVAHRHGGWRCAIHHSLSVGADRGLGLAKLEVPLSQALAGSIESGKQGTGGNAFMKNQFARDFPAGQFAPDP